MAELNLGKHTYDHSSKGGVPIYVRRTEDGKKESFYVPAWRNDPERPDTIEVIVRYGKL